MPSQEIEGLPADVEAVSGVVATLVSKAGPVEQTAQAVEARMSQLENTVAGAPLSPCALWDSAKLCCHRQGKGSFEQCGVWESDGSLPQKLVLVA